MDSQSEAVAIQAIRNARGNSLCVDCGAPTRSGSRGFVPSTSSGCSWRRCPPPRRPLAERLLGAVRDRDLAAVLLLLAHSLKEQLNVATADADRRMALPLACDSAQVVVTQLAGVGTWRLWGTAAWAPGR
ncbi:hypothetical protein DUI87_00414 [Hirundo rustica rustica]|uniref:Uncharacterized protein n=1 Tax=Hirundo rustica rustica TaxID=333673 RepID=A0A3M0LC29_HIRRU|nr:hypothetical protein DUI87_00414 [Hirundo rustica rustica]